MVNEAEEAADAKALARVEPARYAQTLLSCAQQYPGVPATAIAVGPAGLTAGKVGCARVVCEQNQPVQIISVGEGHFRFVLATRKDSPIRNIGDLKGKTVGALLGGDPYNVLSQMLRYELGNPDPKAFNITVVNTPTQVQAATIPTGMDAAVLIHPAYLKAQFRTDADYRAHRELVAANADRIRTVEQPRQHVIALPDAQR